MFALSFNFFNIKYGLNMFNFKTQTFAILNWFLAYISSKFLNAS